MEYIIKKKEEPKVMEDWIKFKLTYPKRFYLKEYKGYTFIVHQDRDYGHLSGFIQIKPIDDFDYKIFNLECHGDITYQGILDFLFDNSKNKYIGFDCAHFGDKQPFLDAQMPSYLVDSSTVWRDEAYVEENCKSIIDQLIELQKGNYIL